MEDRVIVLRWLKAYIRSYPGTFGSDKDQMLYSLLRQLLEEREDIYHYLTEVLSYDSANKENNEFNRNLVDLLKEIGTEGRQTMVPLALEISPAIHPVVPKALPFQKDDIRSTRALDLQEGGELSSSRRSEPAVTEEKETQDPVSSRQGQTEQINSARYLENFLSCP